MTAEANEEWAYRNNDDSLSERVRVLRIHQQTRGFRADVQFLDGKKGGTIENIPGKRLRVRWEGVEQYDLLMSNWARLRAESITDPESSAVGEVFRWLIPSEVATLSWKPVRDVVELHNSHALHEAAGIPVEALVEFAAFELGGLTLMSPQAALLIAEFACRKGPDPVLDTVLEEEREIRSRISKRSSDAQFEYKIYIEEVRPTHEILRTWCGYRAATAQQRLQAAELEVRRLQEITTRLLDALREQPEKALFVSIIEQKIEDERITPENVRPSIGRPLKISELPIREVERRRRW